MRISRLQLLLLLILAGMVYGWWHLRQSSLMPKKSTIETPVQPIPSTPTATPTTPPSQTTSATPQEATKFIAIVGEAYLPLSRQFGEIIEVAQALRLAKKELQLNHPDSAMVAGKEAWKGLKIYQDNLRQRHDIYEVKKGDTLWAIAAKHSPAKRGAAWPVLWHTNKAVISNFDDVPPGTFLKIPQTLSQYAMPYWKPSNEH